MRAVLSSFYSAAYTVAGFRPGVHGYVRVAAVIDSGAEIPAVARGWPKKAREKVSIMRIREEPREFRNSKTGNIIFQVL